MDNKLKRYWHDYVDEIETKIVIDATGSFGSVRSKLPDSMCVKFPRKIKNGQF